VLGEPAMKRLILVFFIIVFFAELASAKNEELCKYDKTIASRSQAEIEAAAIKFAKGTLTEMSGIEVSSLEGVEISVPVQLNSATEIFVYTDALIKELQNIKFKDGKTLTLDQLKLIKLKFPDRSNINTCVKLDWQFSMVGTYNKGGHFTGIDTFAKTVVAADAVPYSTGYFATGVEVLDKEFQYQTSLNSLSNATLLNPWVDDTKEDELTSKNSDTYKSAMEFASKDEDHFFYNVHKEIYRSNVTIQKDSVGGVSFIPIAETKAIQSLFFKETYLFSLAKVDQKIGYQWNTEMLKPIFDKGRIGLWDMLYKKPIVMETNGVVNVHGSHIFSNGVNANFSGKASAFTYLLHYGFGIGTVESRIPLTSANTDFQSQSLPIWVHQGGVEATYEKGKLEAGFSTEFLYVRLNKRKDQTSETISLDGITSLFIKVDI